MTRRHRHHRAHLIFVICAAAQLAYLPADADPVHLVTDGRGVEASAQAQSEVDYNPEWEHAYDALYAPFGAPFIGNVFAAAPVTAAWGEALASQDSFIALPLVWGQGTASAEAGATWIEERGGGNSSSGGTSNFGVILQVHEPSIYRVRGFFNARASPDENSSSEVIVSAGLIGHFTRYLFVDYEGGVIATFSHSGVLDSGEYGFSASVDATAGAIGFDSEATSPNCYGGYGVELRIYQITADKTITDLNGGTLEAGDEVEYSVVLGNLGLANRPNNRGRELKDRLRPKQLELLDAWASSGNVRVKLSKNLVRWSGALAGEGQVTITIRARVKPDATGRICNRAFAFYDADRSGDNDTRVPTDDPRTPRAGDKTCALIGRAVAP